VAFVLLIIVVYLSYVSVIGGRANVVRLSQIILQKHYTKMKAEKTVAISIGKTVPKNAPIKYAEIVEGLSDAEADEATGSSQGQSLQKDEPAAIGNDSVNQSRLMHESSNKLNLSQQSELQLDGANKDKTPGSTTGKTTKVKSSGIRSSGKYQKNVEYFGPVMPSRMVYYDFRNATEAQVQLHVKGKMAAITASRRRTLDEPDESSSVRNNLKRQVFKRGNRHTDVQMSIIPEKKEEFDVSPSLVDDDQLKRRK